jgi:VanZ family protein
MRQVVQVLLRLVTAAYAVVLVVATHIPRLDVSLDVGLAVPTDKFLHFAAYGVLGFLVGLITANFGRGWHGWLPLTLAAIAVFALIDETTQPMFGRAAETFDWFADVVGGAVGLIVATAVTATARRLGRPAGAKC